jgi:PhzF family phenazine biosynthesis protein
MTLSSSLTIDMHATSSREFELWQVDAFTSRRFEGNPAGVVLDADSLSDAEMQAIARELNNSETAFIMRAQSPEHDLRIRYFSPRTEVPFCGHATIASHYVRSLVGNLGSHTVRQEALAGIIDVEVIRDGDAIRVSMRQLPPEFGPPLSDEIASRVARALGAEPSDLRDDCPVQVVSTAHSKILVGLRSRDVLIGLKPDPLALTQLSREIGSNGYHVFVIDAVEPGVLTTCRMFAPAIGVAEDPVTGNGNGPLGAFLVQHHLVDHPQNGAWSFRSAQGHCVSRPGIADVTVMIEDGRPARVHVAGTAVAVFTTTLRLNA